MLNFCYFKGFIWFKDFKVQLSLSGLVYFQFQILHELNIYFVAGFFDLNKIWNIFFYFISFFIGSFWNFLRNIGLRLPFKYVFILKYFLKISHLCSNLTFDGLLVFVYYWKIEISGIQLKPLINIRRKFHSANSYI